MRWNPYSRSSNTIFKFKKSTAISLGTAQAACEILFLVSMVGCIWLGSKMVHYCSTVTPRLYKEVSTLQDWLLGRLLQKLCYIQEVFDWKVLGNSGKLSAVVADIARALSASKNLFEMIERKSEVNLNGSMRLNELRGEIEFKNVEFSVRFVIELGNISISFPWGFSAW